MNITFIVAVDKVGGMGCNNGLLVHLPDELKFFKQQTSGHTVIMGRLTFESIGKPLPNRRNIILTRNCNYSVEGCQVINSIEECLRVIENEKEEIFVIGGASIFEQVFSKCDRILMTVIDHQFDNADTFFPNFDKLFERRLEHNIGWNKPDIMNRHSKDDKHPYEYVTYEIKKSKKNNKELPKSAPINQFELAF